MRQSVCNLMDIKDVLDQFTRDPTFSPTVPCMMELVLEGIGKHCDWINEQISIMF